MPNSVIVLLVAMLIMLVIAFASYAV